MREIVTNVKDYYGNNASGIVFSEEEFEDLPIISKEGSTSVVRKLDEYTLIKEFVAPEFQENIDEYFRLLGYKNDAVLALQKLVFVDERIVGGTMSKAYGESFLDWEKEKKAFTILKLKLALRNLDLAMTSFSKDKNTLCDIKMEHLFFHSAHGRITIIDTERFLTHLNLSRDYTLFYNRRLLAPLLLSFSLLHQIEMEHQFKHSPTLNTIYQSIMNGERPFYELVDLYQTMLPISTNVYYNMSVGNIPILSKMKSR